MPEISKRFEREAANVKRSIDSLNRIIEVLKGGDWFGEGANAFYREMRVGGDAGDAAAAEGAGNGVWRHPEDRAGSP